LEVKIRRWQELRGHKLDLGGVWDFSAPRFLAKQFHLHALSSRKNGGVVKAPKEVLHELQFFVELLHSRVRGAVSNTPLILVYTYIACGETKPPKVKILTFMDALYSCIGVCG